MRYAASLALTPAAAGEGEVTSADGMREERNVRLEAFILDGLGNQVCVTGVVCQFRCRGICCLQRLECPAVEQSPPRRSGFGIDHLADLLMGEGVYEVARQRLHVFSFKQQLSVEQFIQSGHRLRFIHPGHAAEIVKRSRLGQYRSGREQLTRSGRYPRQPA